jgi:DNA-binding SARP family transcriptional activator
VEIRVLGPVELVDEGAVVGLPALERTLVAALAARVGERVAAEVLEEALWPTRRPDTARKTLQGYIMRLRRVLGAESIVHQSGGYRLEPNFHVDARQVAKLVSDAHEAIRRGAPDDAVGLLATRQSRSAVSPTRTCPTPPCPRARSSECSNCERP